MDADIAAPQSAPEGPDVPVGRHTITVPDAQALIRATDAELKSALLRYAGAMPMSQINMGKMALSAPGKVMSAVYDLDDGRQPAAMPRWPLFVLLSCQACNPARPEAWRAALPAAVAVEIAMAAADLIDEITDDDPSPFVAQYGAGQALNTGSLMLVMAQQILLRTGLEATHAYPDPGAAAFEACETLEQVLVEAAVGQHLDMLYGDMEPHEVDLEMSVSMTALKAGALVSGACRIGAIMAQAPAEVVHLLTKIGKEMGSLAQVLNDVQDVMPLPADEAEQAVELPERKTDLRRRKRTLPIVFTLREESDEPNLVQKAFSNSGEKYDEEDLRRAVLDAGGIHFANLIAEVHKQNGLEALAQLDALRPGALEIMSPLLS